MFGWWLIANSFPAALGVLIFLKVFSDRMLYIDSVIRARRDGEMAGGDEEASAAP